MHSSTGSPPGPHCACLPRPASGHGAQLPSIIWAGVLSVPLRQHLSGPGCHAYILAGVNGTTPAAASRAVPTSWAWVCGGPCLQPLGMCACACCCPPSPSGDMPCTYRTCYRQYVNTAFHWVWGLAALGTTRGGRVPPLRQQLRPCSHHGTAMGGPCLQPPSALAKHGAGLPCTCPTYVHSVFSPLLSSSWGRGIPPDSCHR